MQPDLLPTDPDALAAALDASLLERALGRELTHRPSWAGVPLRGVLELLDPSDLDPGGRQ